MTLPRNWKAYKDPHHPPDWDEQVVYAVRQLFKGAASESQQLLVRDYLMYVTAASDEFQDLSYRPGDQIGTAFAEGRRFVGMMFRKLLRPECNPKPKPPERP